MSGIIANYDRGAQRFGSSEEHRPYQQGPYPLCSETTGPSYRRERGW